MSNPTTVPLPFADPLLPVGARLLARTLQDEWARTKDVCWPSDRTIAQKTGLSRGHIQRCLACLERADYIRRQTTASQRTDGRVIRRRIIHLLWRADTSTGARTPPAPVRQPAPAPARQQNVVVGRTKQNPQGASSDAGAPQVRPGSNPQVPDQRQRQEPSTPVPPEPPCPAGPFTAQEARPGPVPASTTEQPLVHLDAEEASRRPPADTSALGAWKRLAEASGDPELAALAERLTPVMGAGPAPEPAPEPFIPVEGTSSPPSGISLTPGETSRLQSLSPTTREQVLSWLSCGDSILIGEARRLLRPPAPRPAEPSTILELLRRLREDASFPSRAAQALSQEFDDPRSWSGFHRALERAWRGELPVEVLLDAYSQASGPRARNRGAIWNHVIGCWDRSRGGAGERIR